MSNVLKTTTKEIIVIIAIVVVFVLVFFIFYTEIIKRSKIEEAKNNFYIVKRELTIEVNKCKEKDNVWFFDIPCDQKLTKEIISDYINKTNKIKNPYDGSEAVQGTSGSVQINIRENSLVMSVDIHANGGIDIEHTIFFLSIFER